MHSVLETPIFTRRADALLSREERVALIDMLANNPLVGEVIQGTGGVRKARFAVGNKGKSGGVRVVYYVLNDEAPIVAIILYGKNEQSNLTPDERRGAQAIVTAMKADMARRKAG